MMLKVSIVAALASLSFASASLAATPETDAFVTNVRLNNVFIARASELAGSRSSNAALKQFASAEAPAVDAVTTAIDARSTPLVAKAEMATVPASEMITGRSVATGRTTSNDVAAPLGVGALMPAALITLEHLAAQKTDGFDALYKATQVNALRQLAALYNAYSLTGDDAMLRQMAGEELAATHRRIAEIGRF